ncbi:MAG: hypothetical protein ABI634_12820 [Acidobacteriota bacterium]
MIPIPPRESLPGARRVVLGAGQPEYEPLPAVVTVEGLVMTEWELTAVELQAVLEGGRLRLWVHTFGRGFSPVELEVIRRNGQTVER